MVTFENAFRFEGTFVSSTYHVIDLRSLDGDPTVAHARACVSNMADHSAKKSAKKETGLGVKVSKVCCICRSGCTCAVGSRVCAAVASHAGGRLCRVVHARDCGIGDDRVLRHFGMLYPAAMGVLDLGGAVHARVLRDAPRTRLERSPSKASLTARSRRSA